MTKKQRFNPQETSILVISGLSNLVIDRADVRQSHPLRWLFVKLDKIRRFLLFWAGSECKGFRFLLLLMTQRERTIGLVPRLRRSDSLRDRYPSPSGLG